MPRYGRLLWVPLLTIPIAIALSGCGNGGLDLEEVTGTITYRGQGVAGGKVMFVPEGGGPVAHGTTDKNGFYRLGTRAPGDGAVAGRHRVAVVLRGPDKPIPAGRAGQMMKEDMEGTGDPLIPVRYFSAATSKLTATVTPGGDNEFNFELRD